MSGWLGAWALCVRCYVLGVWALGRLAFCMLGAGLCQFVVWGVWRVGRIGRFGFWACCVWVLGRFGRLGIWAFSVASLGGVWGLWVLVLVVLGVGRFGFVV